MHKSATKCNETLDKWYKTSMEHQKLWIRWRRISPLNLARYVIIHQIIIHFIPQLGLVNVNRQKSSLSIYVIATDKINVISTRRYTNG
jgi:hypothetical protein